MIPNGKFGSMFNNVYRGKKVLVTGNTGFKGSWLTVWLLKIGADVVGLSDEIPTSPSMFEELKLEQRIKHYFADVRDRASVTKIIQDEKPDFIFHLAAQAIVSTSYDDPVRTITTNAIGTMNVLEALRQLNLPCVAVMITSDKCYDNVEQIWGYKEDDAVGGKDVYSGSKGMAELVIKSYFHSFMTDDSCNIKLGVGRAGNVIGGGDWAKDRIVVDCMLAWSEGETVEIRSPQATRPWQHVMEPLSGYLTLGMALSEAPALHGETFNFGPAAEQNHTVVELLEDLGKSWGLSAGEGYTVTDNIPFHEAGLLKLNCDKALFHMKWQANMIYSETILMVSAWYYSYYREEIDMYQFTLDQIESYADLAAERRQIWNRQ
jgi:CDP-glucose 4,6-dehydratase